MCLKTISPENKEKEDKILEKLFLLIDDNKSIIFNSGAGSGKTYALIECLKHIVKINGDLIKRQNQRIVCITYTNVATDKVKERLGNSSLILTSTIHTRVWDLISRYKKNELVTIHKEKLEDKINRINKRLDLHDDFKEYRELTAEEREVFLSVMLENQEQYYNVRNYKATNFRSRIKVFLIGFNSLLGNVEKFKKIVSSLYNVDKYTKALEYIAKNKKGYKEINYTDNYNMDVLHRMRISHDTLLEYGLKMVKKYDGLKRIIIDQYPYFLVDEYQDTSPLVVELLNELQNHAKSINHNFIVGYFGDKAQNIYSTGAVGEIDKIDDKYQKINKEFNRRSSKEVIDVINIIRNDEIKQQSIYEDSQYGSVEFFQGKIETAKQFIQKCTEEWSINIKNKLHCFVLTNESVANYTGFSNVYYHIRKCGKYKVGLGFQQVTTETLNDDITKLGSAQLLLFKIIHMIKSVNTPKWQLKDTLVNKQVYSKINYRQLQDLTNTIKKIRGNTLKEYLEHIFIEYNKSTADQHYKLLVKVLFENDEPSYDAFANYLFDDLNEDENTSEDTSSNIDMLLNCSIDEFLKWCSYILRDWQSEIVYHTYHGTKGLEFENVVIIMENNFGRSNYFNKLFSEFPPEHNYTPAQNLLYVACSRAIKNLRVFYIDDVSSFSRGIISIFGKVHDFEQIQPSSLL